MPSPRDGPSHEPVGPSVNPALCAPLAVPALRYLMLVEVPMLLGLAALSTLDGFALIAYSWEQETMYYVRLATGPAAGLAVVGSLPLQVSETGF